MVLNKIKSEFLNSMKPIIEELNNSWFPADEKSPEGMFYACTYCDTGCGRNDKHDSDCYYQLAKNTMAAWEEIDRSDRWNTNWKNEQNPPELVEGFRDLFKYDAIFKHFIVNASWFVPLDYSDTERGVVCLCSMFGYHSGDEHHVDCVDRRVAAALRNLFVETGPRPKDIE
jgi:hypothetical protein